MTSAAFVQGELSARLAETGEPVSLIPKSYGTFNPATGKAVVWDLATISVQGTIRHATAAEADGVSVMIGDVFVVVAAAAVGQRPDPDWRMEAGGLAYKVLDLQAFRLQGVEVYYELHGRKAV